MADDPLDAYQGLWKRTLYAEPADGPSAFVDHTSKVYWLQCGPWHADLRIPADRPEFSGITRLDDCSHEQLVWLASQTAFAGRTVVEGRYCTWHRLIDLSPGMDNDIGEMRFIDGDTLEERHPGGKYREIWKRLEADRTRTAFTLDDHEFPTLLRVGRHAMAVCSTRRLCRGHRLLDSARSLGLDELRARASIEISYARLIENQWRIQSSSHPWREKTPLALDN